MAEDFQTPYLAPVLGVTPEAPTSGRFASNIPCNIEKEKCNAYYRCDAKCTASPSAPPLHLHGGMWHRECLRTLDRLSAQQH